MIGTVPVPAGGPGGAGRGGGLRAARPAAPATYRLR